MRAAAVERLMAAPREDDEPRAGDAGVQSFADRERSLDVLLSRSEEGLRANLRELRREVLVHEPDERAAHRAGVLVVARSEAGNVVALVERGSEETIDTPGRGPEGRKRAQIQAPFQRRLDLDAVRID